MPNNLCSTESYQADLWCLWALSASWSCLVMRYTIVRGHSPLRLSTSKVIPHHTQEAMLHQVRGHPKLRLHQAEDVERSWHHHSCRKLPKRLQMWQVSHWACMPSRPSTPTNAHSTMRFNISWARGFKASTSGPRVQVYANKSEGCPTRLVFTIDFNNNTDVHA
jgi:hypothetical protein